MSEDEITREQFLKAFGAAAGGAVVASVTPKEGVALASTVGEEICQVGRRHLGVPYVRGGTSLERGCDCDAYVKKVLGRCGIWAPWGPAEQATHGKRRHGHPHRGDVVAFNEHGHGVSHVAIYSGNGHILHESSYFGKSVESEIKYVSGHCATRVYR